VRCFAQFHLLYLRVRGRIEIRWGLVVHPLTLPEGCSCLRS
jgi:hypothetical protein